MDPMDWDDEGAGDDDPVTIYGVLIRETQSAVLLETDAGQIWLPKNHVIDRRDGTWSVAQWLAKDRGLI